MPKKSYSEKLRDPKWQKRRLKILDRDKFTCRRCGDTEKELHVHHAFYEKNTSPWDYPDEMLFTFCKDCHETIESTLKRISLAVVQNNFCETVLKRVAERVIISAGHAERWDDLTRCISHELPTKIVAIIKHLMEEIAFRLDQQGYDKSDDSDED